MAVIVFLEYKSKEDIKIKIVFQFGCNNFNVIISLLRQTLTLASVSQEIVCKFRLVVYPPMANTEIINYCTEEQFTCEQQQATEQALLISFLCQT